MTTPPLFELPDGEPLPRARTLRETARDAVPKWTRYRSVRRVACDECIMLLAENQGQGPYARAALWRRRTPDRDLVLCTEHARTWRAEDKTRDRR